MRLAVRRLGLAARPATREVRRKIGHRNYSTNPGATRITGSDGLPLAVPAPKPQPLLTGAAEAIVEAKEAILEESMEYIVRFGVFLKKHPLKANAMVSCGFCIVSDMLAQAVEWRQAVSSPEKVEYNYKRTARMAAWGFMIGPVISVWYRTLHIGTEAMQVSYAPVVRGRIAGLLERINPNWSPVLHLQRDRQHSPTALVLGKVVIDTCMFQLPLINAYFAFMGFAEGLPADKVLEKTKDAFYRAWGIGFLVWCPVQMINLHYVPVHFQGVVVSVVNVGWKTTLSLLNHYVEYGSPKLNAPLIAENAQLRQRVVDLEAELEASRRQGFVCALLCPCRRPAADVAAKPQIT